MTTPKIPDDEFISLFTAYGPAKLATMQGTSVRTVYQRRKVIEHRTGQTIPAPSLRGGHPARLPNQPERHHIGIADGVALIGSVMPEANTSLTSRTVSFIALLRLMTVT